MFGEALTCLPLVMGDVASAFAGGPLIGRYPDDSYSKNRPWYLTSFALAACHYLQDRAKHGNEILTAALAADAWLEPDDTQLRPSGASGSAAHGGACQERGWTDPSPAP